MSNQLKQILWYSLIAPPIGGFMVGIIFFVATLFEFPINFHLITEMLPFIAFCMMGSYFFGLVPAFFSAWALVTWVDKATPNLIPLVKGVSTVTFVTLLINSVFYVVGNIDALSLKSFIKSPVLNLTLLACVTACVMIVAINKKRRWANINNAHQNK